MLWMSEPHSHLDIQYKSCLPVLIKIIFMWIIVFEFWKIFRFSIITVYTTLVGLYIFSHLKAQFIQITIPFSLLPVTVSDLEDGFGFICASFYFYTSSLTQRRWMESLLMLHKAPDSNRVWCTDCKALEENLWLFFFFFVVQCKKFYFISCTPPGPNNMQASSSSTHPTLVILFVPLHSRLRSIKTSFSRHWRK